jgi:3-deoxy-7-phosphoheptulonate synthase
VGLMLESNLFEGSQTIPKDLKQLQYGVSVTDKCMGWDMTEKVLREMDDRLQHRVKVRRNK